MPWGWGPYVTEAIIGFYCLKWPKRQKKFLPRHKKWQEDKNNVLINKDKTSTAGWEVIGSTIFQDCPIHVQVLPLLAIELTDINPRYWAVEHILNKHFFAIALRIWGEEWAGVGTSVNLMILYRPEVPRRHLTKLYLRSPESQVVSRLKSSEEDATPLTIDLSAPFLS